MLFEVAWEVCNQIGGIYQVLRSKAPAMVEQWNARYCLVGPDNEHSAQVEFEAHRPPSAMARALEALEQAGLTARHGRWLISGRPRVILLGHHASQDRLSELKYQLWKDHAVETPDDPLIDGAIMFADATYQLFAALSQHYAPRLLIAHFHEWMGGMAIPLIRRAKLPVATVFTTHATILGRYIASSRSGLYDQLPYLNDADEARNLNIEPIHRLERACAHGAHIFTTVSEVTGEECTHLLGRTPDVYLPNGLNVTRYEALHQLQYLHKENKERIHRFIRGHFFPSYSFDLDKTRYFFTSGRYEPRNKGFDLCLEACARLNAELKASDLDTNVVFFIITRRPTRQIISECLERRAVLGEMRDTCRSIIEQVGERFFEHAVAGQTPKLDGLVDEYWMLRLKRTIQAWRQGGDPPVVTHVLEDEAGDLVLGHVKHLHLFNAQHDRVKVVYHPDFISTVSPLWKMEYEQFVRGCHLGVFPSAYEPWGYTPLECIASGIPAVTSDLAGFGRYVQRHFDDHDDWGMWIVDRRSRDFHDSAAQLARIMLRFCGLDRRERMKMRNAAEQHAGAFDWADLVRFYNTAHEQAVAAVL
ncbi:MAG: glycosyltransferase [Phycisphaerales bacterium]|nr:glycosyltransferase [Phycisphaerales bacterium]